MAELTVVEVLRTARALIETPERWSSGAVTGLVTDARSRALTDDNGRLSAENAVLTVRADSVATTSSALFWLSGAADHLGFLWVHELERMTDHATLMTCFDLAIEMAERGY